MNLIGNINAIPFRRFRGGGGVAPFPFIPGMIARYSAKDLTNEQMAANPVWVDKTGNVHDLQLKNFAWGGMSGVGGYADNFVNWEVLTDRADVKITTNSFFISSVKKSSNSAILRPSKVGEIVPSIRIKVSGLIDGMGFVYMDSLTNIILHIPKDGIYTLPSYKIEPGVAYVSIKFDKIQESCNITIEQLPLYPGALVFDGVDDCGVCDNFPTLTKEKGYTVVVLRQWDQDFLNTTLTGGLLSTRNYSTGEGVAFEKIESSNKGYWNLGAGGIIDFAKSPFTWQTSKQYNNVGILKGDKNHGKPLCVGCGLSGGQQCGRFAIWELVFLDHDATEEELTKIKDYFVKTYPWLFPDQAWTVVGKTNEDEDRTTIANITGNGNNFVLSNFGFAEGSGYGLYAENYAGGRWVQSTDRADLTWTNYSVNITSVKVASTQLYYQSYPEQPSFTVPSYKIKVYGLKDGQTLSYKQVTSEGQQIYKISEDGTYTLPSFPFKANGDWYGFTLNKVQESCDITIEQIPEYEGYLVTDGVDDEIISAKLIQFADKFTIVGDWKFMEDRNDKAGLLKANQIYIYNTTTGMRIYLKQGSRHYSFSCKKINALTSDGWAYDEKWDKYKVYPIGSDIDISSRLFLGFYSSNFTKIALKNLGIYNDQLLSKDDCIKAYNYLQTLKAK